MVGSKIKRVHCVFEAHPETAHFVRGRKGPLNGTKTAFIEDALGRFKFDNRNKKKIAAQETKKAKQSDLRFYKTESAYIADAALRGIKVKTGEGAGTAKQRARLEKLFKKQKAAQSFFYIFFWAISVTSSLVLRDSFSAACLRRPFSHTLP